MEFDKSKVYTAANADELKIGSKIIVSNYFASLRNQVEANSYPAYIKELTHIMGTSSTNRFEVDDNQTYNLAYLVSEPGEKKMNDEALKICEKCRKEQKKQQPQLVNCAFLHDNMYCDRLEDINVLIEKLLKRG